MATQWTAGTVSGQILTAATLNTIGAVTVDYTPTLTQGVAVTKTVVQARYFQFQKFVQGTIVLNATSAGTAGQVVAVGLPISARATSTMTAFGYIYDASTNVMYDLQPIKSPIALVGLICMTVLIASRRNRTRPRLTDHHNDRRICRRKRHGRTKQQTS
jgi:mannitol-1-phosphate/altronate dehydrogenase